MQITINIPDNLPTLIVQQYIQNIEAQMRLMAELANHKPAKKTNPAALRKSCKSRLNAPIYPCLIRAHPMKF